MQSPVIPHQPQPPAFAQSVQLVIMSHGGDAGHPVPTGHHDAHDPATGPAPPPATHCPLELHQPQPAMDWQAVQLVAAAHGGGASSIAGASVPGTPPASIPPASTPVSPLPHAQTSAHT